MVMKVLVPIADDSEDIETACITDVLVRAGAEVTVASVMPSLQVRLARGLKLTADCSIDDCASAEWDAASAAQAGQCAAVAPCGVGLGRLYRLITSTGMARRVKLE